MTESPKLSTIIVDDEPLLRKELSRKLAYDPRINVVAECDNGISAVEAIQRLQPDLVYLDIIMPGLNGFQVIHALQADVMPMIIFATAYDEYAIKAFEVRAVDYLVKPYSDKRLLKSIETALLYYRSPEPQDKQKLIELGSDVQSTEIYSTEEEEHTKWPKELVIDNKEPKVTVEVKSIAWIDAAGDYMCIHANGETYILRCTMKKLESMLDPQFFRRIHKSTIVNTNFVKQIIPYKKGDFFVDLEGDTRLRLSRSYKDNIL